MVCKVWATPQTHPERSCHYSQIARYKPLDMPLVVCCGMKRAQIQNIDAGAASRMPEGQKLVDGQGPKPQSLNPDFNPCCARGVAYGVQGPIELTNLEIKGVYKGYYL